LGLLPYFLIFVALVAALLKMGLIYIAALIVAFITARHQRPELATSRLKVLAFANT
jgi:hypothetical protein